MILVSRTYHGGLPFWFRRPPADATVESRILKAEDFRELRALYWVPRDDARPRVAVVAMHPRVDFAHHYTFPRLLAAGIGCLGASSRSPNNDTDTTHEELLLDVAAAVRWLREHRKVEKVILLGNSGGGALAAFYQAQARLPGQERIALTPGGTPTRLARATMPPADGMIYLAAHRGQGKVLGACIDPSVVDERDPFATDPALDMYEPENGFLPPPAWCAYGDDFVARFRAGQLARVARLDAVARELLHDRDRAAERAGAGDFESLPFVAQQAVLKRKAFDPVMVVYRTMANLHYVDRHLDPSGRSYGSLLSERPDLMNMKLLGFARMVTPEAWLSTWSAASSNAELCRWLPSIEVPTLCVFAGRDREIYPRADIEPIGAAIAAADRTFVTFDHARHYFEGDPGEDASPDRELLLDTLVEWIRDRF